MSYQLIPISVDNHYDTDITDTTLRFIEKILIKQFLRESDIASSLIYSHKGVNENLTGK